MATQSDRDPLTEEAPEAARAARRRSLSWLGALGIGLALALVGAAVVQTRQLTLLSQSLQISDDYVVLSVYQVETEYLRLREQWTQAVADGERFDRDRLQLRYDVWVSRIALLEDGRAVRALLGQTDYESTRRAIRLFILRADRWLGLPPEEPLSYEVLHLLQPALATLGEPVHAMSLSAAHHVSDQIAERNMVVRRHNQVGIGLTLFLSALTLAFAGFSLRQMQQLRERRRSLEQLAGSLRDARLEAESASEAKSAFLANMSHEIRTPFHGLLGMLSLLRETGLTARQSEYLRTATDSADHLLAILNDILDMSQLESGRMTITPNAVDLRALLREVDALMRPQATGKALALHIDTAPQTPERILADATRLKQVLFNLLSNAIKFSDRGTVVLEVRLHAQPDHPPQLEFRVTDTGIGMDAVTVNRLFRRFVQGDATRSRRHGGTGLGLEISRNLARLMGGDITVTSAPGEGSCFVFQMPMHEVPAAVAPAPAAADGTPGLRRLQVLVAEDHSVNRQYMAALLETLGHDGFFAGDGEEAVQAARTQRFDLVLMDLHMPRLDGFGATRAIRALPDRAAATVPIVALTADAFAETRDRCLVTGMNDFLTKPVSPDKLATALRRLFGAPARAEAATAEAPVAQAGGMLLDMAALQRSPIPRPRLATLVADFLDQGPQTVQRLRAGVRDGQPLEVRVHAHAARGTALNLGLPALAATAEALHEGASHLPAHEVARLVQRYEDLLGATRDAAVVAGLLTPALVVTK